jgi:hypothetical protein
MAKFEHFAALSFGVLACILALTPASAATITLSNGSTSSMAITSGGVQIGNLFISVTRNDGIENSEFDLLPQYRSLMSDDLGQQFRFFQVITYDDEPTTWENGRIITSAGTADHVETVVDAPAGGWDYMLPLGEDYVPFYESDTRTNPSTGKPYVYDWAYATTGGATAVHTPDTSTQGWVVSKDKPLLSNPNDNTFFETYITYIDPTLRGRQHFDVLGGFSWGILTGPNGNQFGISPTAIPFENINFAELQGALGRSGYDGWTIVVPESSTALTILIGLALIGLKRFRTLQFLKGNWSPALALPAMSRVREAVNSNHFKRG